ncbi:MAG: DUF2207 domain-containing protein [bacterium]
MAKKFYPFLFLLIIFLFPVLSLAQNQNGFSYDKSKVEIWLNQDSTVDIEEQDYFVLNGDLERLSRKFSGKKFDYFAKLEILNPADKPLERKDYTFANKAESSIDWLIPQDTYVGQGVKYTLKYKIYGAISFLADKDELVWNLIPAGNRLKKTEAVIHLPNINIKKEDIKIDLSTDAINVAKDIYRNDKSVYEIVNGSEFTRPVAAYYLADDNTIHFIGQNLEKGTKFDIQVSLPKGIILEPKVTYGKMINWLIGLGVLIVFLGYLIYYRFFGKKKLQKVEEEEEGNRFRN